MRTIENGNASLLSTILERSKNDALEVDIFSFFISGSEEYLPF